MDSGIVMRVLIVNTWERVGGAAIAANRLLSALNNNGIKAKMLVRDKTTEHITVAALPKSFSLQFKFLWERFCIFIANHFNRENLFQVDIANAGSDITKLREFKEADVIHLNWINQGFLSLKNIRQIIDSGKPIVWTMHDQWPFTGICHYSGDCKKYCSECQSCTLLSNKHGRDLSTKVFRKKLKMLKGSHIVFVACSQWLQELARQSYLLAGQEVICIPNTINGNIFCPSSQSEARLRCNLPHDKKLLLFGSQKATDKRKGIAYLIEACKIIKEKEPELSKKIGVVIVGKNADKISNLFPFPVYAIDYVDDERRMVNIYNSVDVFITPSLEDNLPNTIVEAMSCGIPCVAFKIGGIPEMIEHKKNGYLAEPRNADDLAEGIEFILDNSLLNELKTNACHSALSKYGETNIAAKYIAAYRRAGMLK